MHNPAYSDLALKGKHYAMSSRVIKLTPRTVFLFQIKDYEKLDSEEERLSRSRQIYDVYIMKELLSCSHVRTPLQI